jgi:hypothetical protein
VSGGEARLVREAVEVELAAAEVEDVAVAGELVAEVGGEGIDVVLAVFFHFEETGFAEDAEVFGDVVGGCAEEIAEFADGAGACDEMADEAEPGGFSQSAHGGEAIEGLGVGAARHGGDYHSGGWGARRADGGCLFADVGK